MPPRVSRRDGGFPRDVEDEYNLAYVLLRQSKTDEATDHLRAVLARHPDHPGANYQLGKALLDGGQTKEAITYLEAACSAVSRFGLRALSAADGLS